MVTGRRSKHEIVQALRQSDVFVLVSDFEGLPISLLEAMAQGVVHQMVQVLAPDCASLFLTDGFREYATALLTHYGQWVQPPRRQATGPAPKPRWMPLPQLLCAQVVKS